MRQRIRSATSSRTWARHGSHYSITRATQTIFPAARMIAAAARRRAAPSSPPWALPVQRVPLELLEPRAQRAILEISARPEQRDRQVRLARKEYRATRERRVPPARPVRQEPRATRVIQERPAPRELRVRPALPAARERQVQPARPDPRAQPARSELYSKAYGRMRQRIRSGMSSPTSARPGSHYSITRATQTIFPAARMIAAAARRRAGLSSPPWALPVPLELLGPRAQP